MGWANASPGLRRGDAEAEPLPGAPRFYSFGNILQERIVRFCDVRAVRGADSSQPPPWAMQPPSMAADAASVPRRFGKYQILDRIAVGGMAEIFRARLDGIGGFQRSFAIKRIAPHLSTNHEFVEMLVDEAKVAGLLSHANIVQILDLGNVDQQFYIAMEYVNGRDLRQVLSRCTDKSITLPVPHAVFVLIEMLKGLEYAHNRQVMRGGKPVPLNIVHRDISPGNVLVSFQGEVKLTDFGIAKASVKALETMSGVVKGRFDYMSPEQASGAAVDQRSDLYSAGVLFYEVLTGRHPFRQVGELATLEAVRRGVFVPPSQVNPDVPYSLDLVVEQALRVRPEERHQSAAAFKETLDRFFHDSGFIFSASTLAAFLRGLFPEAVAAERRPPGDAPTRPLEPEDLELEDDEPSSHGARPSPLPRRQADASGPSVTTRAVTANADASSPGSSTALSTVRPLPMGALPPASGEDSTLIRSPRGPRAFTLAAAPEENPFGEVNTVIRPPQAGGGEGVDTVRLAMGSQLAEPGAAPGAPAASPAVAAAAAPARRPARQGPSRVGVQVHAAWALVCFAAAVAAFVLGLLVGSRMHHVAAPAPAAAALPEK